MVPSALLVEPPPTYNDNISPECYNFTRGNWQDMEFYSPGYPNRYPNKIDCVMYLQGEFVFIPLSDLFSEFRYKILSMAVFFLAHLSRRLTGELIVYPCSGVRRPSSINSKIFFSETTWPINLKFYVEPPWEGGIGGMKDCSRDLGHMTKMAATPIYSKIFSRTGGPIFTKLGM